MRIFSRKSDWRRRGVDVFKWKKPTWGFCLILSPGLDPLTPSHSCFRHRSIWPSTPPPRPIPCLPAPSRHHCLLVILQTKPQSRRELEQLRPFHADHKFSLVLGAENFSPRIKEDIMENTAEILVLTPGPDTRPTFVCSWRSPFVAALAAN